MKQIEKVMVAVTEGCFTSDQCSAFTGLSIATCSSYLSVLAEDGLIRRSKKSALKLNSRGPRSHIYVPSGAPCVFS